MDRRSDGCLGSTVSGTVQLGGVPGIAIPSSALTSANGQPAVWVLDPRDKRVALRNVEVVRYGKGQDFMALLATQLTGGGPPWPRWLRWLWSAVRHPLRLARAHWPFGWARRTAILLVMQPTHTSLRLVLARRPWGRTLAPRATDAGHRLKA